MTEFELSFPTQKYNIRGFMRDNLFSWVPMFQSFLKYYFSEHDPTNPAYADPKVVENLFLLKLYNLYGQLNQKRLLDNLRREQQGKLFNGNTKTPLYYYPDVFTPPALRMPFYFVPLQPGVRPYDGFNFPKVAKGLLSSMIG